MEDPQTHKAVVFIGLNNPHVRRAPRKLCPSRCSDLPWVDWDLVDKGAGFMYCCNLQEAREAIKQIPDLEGLKDLGLLGMGVIL